VHLHETLKTPEHQLRLVVAERRLIGLRHRLQQVDRLVELLREERQRLRNLVPPIHHVVARDRLRRGLQRVGQRGKLLQRPRSEQLCRHSSLKQTFDTKLSTTNPPPIVCQSPTPSQVKSVGAVSSEGPNQHVVSNRGASARREQSWGISTS
jgi:hypothetical protein